MSLSRFLKVVKKKQFECLTASCSTLQDRRRKMPGCRDVVWYEGRQGLYEPQSGGRHVWKRGRPAIAKGRHSQGPPQLASKVRVGLGIGLGIGLWIGIAPSYGGPNPNRGNSCNRHAQILKIRWCESVNRLECVERISYSIAHYAGVLDSPV